MPVRGSKSKTHKGDKDYTTKKSSKFYVRKGHEVKPFKQTKSGGFAFLIPLAAGLASGAVSYGTQRGLKALFGGQNKKKKRKH